MGRVSLAPDNMAHTFTIAGGASLPMRTRVNLNLSYSLRLQNDEFLPHTSTQYLAASNPGGLFLPDKSLNGMTGTFLANLNVTYRPLPTGSSPGSNTGRPSSGTRTTIRARPT